MKNLVILIPAGPDNNLSSIVGAVKLFTRANKLFATNGNQPVFKVVLAGLNKTETYFDEIFSVKPHCSIWEAPNAHLVIVPAINHHNNEILRQNQPIINWMKEQYLLGAEIASICTGAFLVAAAGLLNGKTASTHWSAGEKFRTWFPQVNLKTDLLITAEQGIYTNGGAFSFLNLLYYLVEKYYDRATALLCSKFFQIDVGRQYQSTFIIFNNQKLHADEQIKQAQEYLENHYYQPVSINKLCSMLAINRRNFDRRFMKATGNTPLEYLQRSRIEAAKQRLETTRKTVSEIMYEVGYNDTKAFREIFKKITGITPLEYKARYGLERV
ncbi:MAG TPA: helix-turn-helix domain-containing protein [Phnomibacter sp.]|nr:helix-turn-helix domain-containing protein [Phnomibacter sp.]